MQTRKKKRGLNKFLKRNRICWFSVKSFLYLTNFSSFFLEINGNPEGNPFYKYIKNSTFQKITLELTYPKFVDKNHKFRVVKILKKIFSQASLGFHTFRIGIS